VPDYLPNSSASIVKENKVKDYLLSTTHLEGKSKAKFFFEFGYSEDKPEELVDSLRTHASTQPIIETEENDHGTKYVLQCSISTPDGRSPCIITVWIIKREDVEPMLVTAYPSEN
jgi:hypothetical protein